MIQRLQTLWLLAVSALSFTSLKISFFSGNILVANVKQFQRFNAMSSIPLMILTVAVAIASLVLIFMYKDRKQQLKIGFAILVCSIITILLYYFATNNFILNEWSFDIGSFITIAIPVFLIMAIRGIYKDEQLVKSLDRLR